LQVVNDCLASRCRQRPPLPFQLHRRTGAAGQIGHDGRQPAAGKHAGKDEDEDDDEQPKQNLFSRTHLLRLDVVTDTFAGRDFSQRNTID
jgi:hypothetical protein